MCVIELKARFDVETQSTLGERLQEAGAYVFKIHGKTALVVGKEDDGLRTFAHIGTPGIIIAAPPGSTATRRCSRATSLLATGRAGIEHKRSVGLPGSSRR